MSAARPQRSRKTIWPVKCATNAPIQRRQTTLKTSAVSVKPLESGRYLKRWARLLREYGFTREDVLILALCTYGATAAADILGVNGLITLDQRFINNFRTHHEALQQRLRAMTRQLAEPYRQATLPVMLHPTELVT